MQIETFSLGPLGTNCYVVQKDDQCLVIDPGGDAEIVEQFINDQALKPLAILLTHAHFDHIGAVDELRKKYNIDVYLHEQEKDWLENPTLNGSARALGKNGIVTEAPEKILTEGQLNIGPFTCEVAYTPGHSPGSVSFIFRENQFTVSGDVLFNHGIGRTDLPGGSIDELINSIVTKLYTLPKTFTVYRSHGSHTTIGQEDKSNAFTLQFHRP